MRYPHTHVAALCHGLQSTTRAFAAPRLQRSLHQTPALGPRQRLFFTSNPLLSRNAPSDQPPTTTSTPSEKNAPVTEQSTRQEDGEPTVHRPKAPKPSAAKKKLRDPLRRVASLAQRSGRKPPKATQDGESEPGKDYSTSICAICVAESFDMKAVVRILRAHHYLIDPDGLDFDHDEVIPFRVHAGVGDMFVFETGTLVTWALPPELGVNLATGTLLQAAANPHVHAMAQDDMTETLEFETDAAAGTSSMRRDTVVLGASGDPTDMGRTKIAFSSGLARSTKVAVLETLLNTYLEKNDELVAQLKSGKLRWSQTQILQRTGELVQLRSQLNFFSELTDSLPDTFWDQRAELALDNIYDKVGKALDVPSRIQVLNQRMEIANELLETVRGMHDANKSARLEWIIIVLIAIELLFSIRIEMREAQHARESEPAAARG